jgi:Tol biopolymer transport system component
MRFAARSLLFLVALVVVATAGASSFPGANGKLVFAIGGDGPSHLVTANADGSDPTRLTRPTSSSGGDAEPHVSADGTRIVFLRGWTKPIRQIWIVSAAGGPAHRVTISGLPPNRSPWAPTFTPDGKTIVFELDRGSYTSVGIWKVSAAGGRATQVMKGRYSYATVSPNGRRLAFVDQRSIAIASITGKNMKTVFDGSKSSMYARMPTFSPDGKQLAFELYGTGAFDVAIVSSAGGTPTNVTDNPRTGVGSYEPVFSPDGTEIAFIGEDEDNHTWSIRAVPAAGGSSTQLVPASTQYILGLDWQREPSG